MKELGSRLQRVKSVLARPPTNEETTMSVSINKAVKSPTGNAAAAAVKAKKEIDPNLIPLATLCKELKISGQAARRKLRAAKLTKDGRWAFQRGSAEERKVRELLTAKEATQA